jgi:hypothetical protein
MIAKVGKKLYLSTWNNECSWWDERQIEVINNV